MIFRAIVKTFAIPTISMTKLTGHRNIGMQALSMSVFDKKYFVRWLAVSSTTCQCSSITRLERI